MTTILQTLYDSEEFPSSLVEPEIREPPEDIDELISWLKELKTNFIKDPTKQTIEIHFFGYSDLDITLITEDPS